MSVTLHGRRVLVIGWGFLGAAVGRRLVADGVDVVAIARSASERTAAATHAGIELRLGRVERRGVLDGLMDEVDHVVFAAGGLLPAHAAKDPLRDATEMISPWLATLEAVKEHPHVGITMISSGGTVYGNPTRIPVHEDDAKMPVSPYGASRLACATYAASYRATHGLRIQIARCANAYGPGQPHDRCQGAVAVFLHRLLHALPITVFGDGSAVRDYVYIDDVAAAVAHLACTSTDVDAVNIGSGRGHTTSEVLEQLMLLTGRTTEVRYLPERPHDVRRIVLDIGRLRSLMDYAPLPLQAGLALTCAKEDVQFDPRVVDLGWRSSLLHMP